MYSVYFSMCYCVWKWCINFQFVNFKVSKTYFLKNFYFAFTKLEHVSNQMFKTAFVLLLCFCVIKISSLLPCKEGIQSSITNTLISQNNYRCHWISYVCTHSFWWKFNKSIDLCFWVKPTSYSKRLNLKQWSPQSCTFHLTEFLFEQKSLLKCK